MKTNLFLSVLGCLIFTSQNCFAKLPKANSAELQIAENQLSRTLITKAVLFDRDINGYEIPLCAFDTSGKPNLVPSFAKVAPNGFKSSVNFDLPTCDPDQLAALEEMTKTAHLNGVRTAEPLIITIATVGLACSFAAGFGALATADGTTGNVGMFLSGSLTTIGFVEGGPIGGLFSLACVSLGHLGVKYIGELADSTDDLSIISEQVP